MKKRYFKKKPKGLPKGYDSKLELDLHENELVEYDHHPERLTYTVDHKYQPDFVHSDNPKRVIEVKGRFRDNHESSKYKWIRDCNPDYELVFIFQNHLTPMPFSKVRKDGTKMTHGEWADKNKFEWYTRETFKG